MHWSEEVPCTLTQRTPEPSTPKTIIFVGGCRELRNKNIQNTELHTKNLPKKVLQNKNPINDGVGSHCPMLQPRSSFQRAASQARAAASSAAAVGARPPGRGGTKAREEWPEHHQPRGQGGAGGPNGLTSCKPWSTLITYSWVALY